MRISGRLALLVLGLAGLTASACEACGEGREERFGLPSLAAAPKGGLVRALDRAAQAHRDAPDLPETRFNRALVLDRLHLRRLAVAAWEEYLELDRRSGRAAEARRRLEELSAPSAPERWERARPRLEAATLRRDLRQIREIVELDPQAAREHAVETVLGRWADRLLAGDLAGAEHRLRAAALLGEAFLAVNGDPTVAAAVAAVERASGSPARLRGLATGHQAFRDGMEAYRPLRTGEAAVHFSKARQELRRAGSPIELWALCGQARVWGYEGRHEEAARAYHQVLAQAAPREFSSLVGWTQWGLAWLASREGRPAEAYTRMRSAEEAYRRAQETENLGAARFLLGDSLFLLGQPEAGWRWFYEALRALDSHPVVFRRHVLLTSAATAAREEGLLEASLLLQEEALRIAEESGNPIRLTEALWARAETLHALGRTREALADLARAERSAAEAPSDATGRKLRADLLWTRGKVLRGDDPQGAREALDAAIREYQALNAHPSTAYACLTRARTALCLGDDERALADLETALRILSDPVTGIREEDLQVSYAESIQELYDEKIRFHWDRDRSPLAALEAFEQARAFPRLPQGALAEAIGRWGQDATIVEYALLDDRLLTWVIDRGRLSSFERRLDKSALDRLVERFLGSIRRGAGEAETLLLSARLHDLLIPEPVRGLSAGRRIRFVPDRILNKVPFAALFDRETGRFLVEDHPVSIAPTLTQVLRVAEDGSRTRLGGSTALLVGNPAFDRWLFSSLDDLPGAEDELAAARASFGSSRVLLGPQATKKRVLDELRRSEVFVFAGHAVVDSRQPSRSHLVLAPSSDPPDPGLLLGAEVSARSFPELRLVVLSACSSAGPRNARVSGIAGMAQPFLRAGAEAVVGTLWSLEDQSAGEVLRSFYAAVANGTPPDDALRGAQIRSAQGTASLRVWSAFAVVDLDRAPEKGRDDP